MGMDHKELHISYILALLLRLCYTYATKKKKHNCKQKEGKGLFQVLWGDGIEQFRGRYEH